MKYSIKVRQQPKHARMCGFSAGNVERRMLDPPLVLQLDLIDLIEDIQMDLATGESPEEVKEEEIKTTDSNQDVIISQKPLAETLPGGNNNVIGRNLAKLEDSPKKSTLTGNNSNNAGDDDHSAENLSLGGSPNPSLRLDRVDTPRPSSSRPSGSRPSIDQSEALRVDTNRESATHDPESSTSSTLQGCDVVIDPEKERINEYKLNLLADRIIAQVSIISEEKEIISGLIRDKGSYALPLLFGQTVMKGVVLDQHSEDCVPRKTLFFAFPDLSIRVQGDFVIVTQFIDMRTMTVVKTISTQPFPVKIPKDFHGMFPSTDLTRHLFKSGVEIRRRDYRTEI